METLTNVNNKTYFKGETIKEPHGYGKLYDKYNNIIYKGNWKKGKFHGYGKLYKYTFKLNELPKTYLYYQGNFVNGKCSGNGIEYNIFGVPIFEGVWYKNEYKYGIIYNSSKYKKDSYKEYEGECMGKIRCGYGKEYNENGNLIFEGYFDNNKCFI